MSIFEFVFSLFGLVLGLSLAEVLAGFARTVQARKRVRMGWLTPLLGLLLIIDLVSFWTGAWRERDAIGVTLEPLLFATLIAGIYYVAASLVFPPDQEAWPDLDRYFMEHKPIVMGAVIGCNLLMMVAAAIVHGGANMTAGRAVGYGLLAAASLGLIVTRSKRLSLVLLGAMISSYWVVPQVVVAIDGGAMPG
ncbi:MAG TPA: hypothetical protein VEW04_04880 [Allosphingosinicella sp.]|nr:hypothetical protein [Allosphingosinicella sp.]